MNYDETAANLENCDKDSGKIMFLGILDKRDKQNT
jgi:hypothetical protein